MMSIVMGSVAHAETPRGWMFRASPGFGYAWDPAATCAIKGRMFVGGFAVEREVTDGVLVGPATTIVFNLLLAHGPCGAEDGTRLAFGAVIGPAVDWYPAPDRGLYVFGLAGFASLDPADEGSSHPSRGIGGTVGVGWDWRGKQEVGLRIGVRAQLTLARTWTGPVDHHVLAPAIVATFGAD
jgi:hypothetical protein